MFLRVGAPHHDYPPNRMNISGELVGMCIDILEELANRSNFRKEKGFFTNLKLWGIFFSSYAIINTYDTADHTGKITI